MKNWLIFFAILIFFISTDFTSGPESIVFYNDTWMSDINLCSSDKVKRLYPNNLIDKTRSEVKNHERPSALKTKKKTDSITYLPFVTEYHRYVPNNNSLMIKWYLIEKQPL